jgi:cell division septation protein DedD
MQAGGSRRAFWRGTRGTLFAAFCASVLNAAPQDDQLPPDQRRPPKPDLNDDPKLPDGKSQKNAIAREQHEQALKDAKNLVEQAEQLRDELERSGNYTVSMASLKRAEDIEKLAKKIRGRLRY